MKAFWLSARTIAMLMVTAFGFIIATETSAFAQGRPSPIQRRVEQLNRQGEQYERDNPGRDAAGDPNKNDGRASAALLVRIRKDLEGLQSNYNHIVVAMAADKTLPDNQILDAVIEIRDCSTRLRHNLALPQAKDEKSKTLTPVASDPTDASLLTLREHIYRFVMNPMFEAPAVLDVEQGKKASHDLDRVIEISDSIARQFGKKKTAR